MKTTIAILLFSSSAFAQIPGMAAIKDVSKQVLEACKEDKSKIKGCESYTELPKLKACLMTNKDQLSEKCKASLKLVK